MIQDNAYEDGKLVERTLDYFAQADDGTVHYLGEHVNNIRRGRVIDHNGSWLYGKHTDVLGVAMPAARSSGISGGSRTCRASPPSQIGSRRPGCARGRAAGSTRT